MTKPLNYRIGQELYRVCVYEDDGQSKMDQWRIRSKRRSRVYAVLVAPWTWVKRSKKHGDYGWATSIPSWCRESTEDGEPFTRLYTTKLQAWRAAKRSLRRGAFDDGPTGDAAYIRATRTIKLKAK